MSEESLEGNVKRTRRKPLAPDGRQGNARPVTPGIERPNCKRCIEEGRGTIPMISNGSKPDARLWKCKQCGYRFSQLTRAPKTPGNRAGVKIATPGPGRRRKDDLKGQRVDLLTTTLEKIVEAPARSTELSEAILQGGDVLAWVKADPI